MEREVLHFEGSGVFRHHLVCSLLSNRPVKLDNIGAGTRDKAGLSDYEVNFMKFIDRSTSGSKFEVRDGTSAVTFRPGMILGGVFTHAVPPSRSVAYIIEAAMLFLPFAKHASEITFTGVTQHDMDLALDTLRTVTVRWLRLFSVECSMRIVKRGAAPDGGGVVILSVANVRRLRTINVTERGKMRRVRGIAYSSNVSADLTKQAASAAKGMLLGFLPDIYIVADNFSTPLGQRAAGTSGYGLMLVAESTAATCVLSHEGVGSPDVTPEDFGRKVAERLLDEVSLGGCVDSHHQMTVLLLMAAAPDNVSTVRLGSLTESGVTAMTLMESFFGITCAVKEESNPYGMDDMPSSIVVSCIGSNVTNIAKKTG